MEIGVYTILTDETMLPGETAKLIEDAGLDAMAMGFVAGPGRGLGTVRRRP